MERKGKGRRNGHKVGEQRPLPKRRKNLRTERGPEPAGVSGHQTNLMSKPLASGKRLPATTTHLNPWLVLHMEVGRAGEIYSEPPAKDSFSLTFRTGLADRSSLSLCYSHF